MHIITAERAYTFRIIFSAISAFIHVCSQFCVFLILYLSLSWFRTSAFTWAWWESLQYVTLKLPELPVMLSSAW